jgi:hypothetical protein
MLVIFLKFEKCIIRAKSALGCGIIEGARAIPREFRSQVSRIKNLETKDAVISLKKN